MFIFGEGKRALLDFVRNLTPQIVLVALPIVLSAQIDFGRIDLSNWPSTLGFYSCIFVLAAATWANFTLFIDASLEAVGRYQRVTRVMVRADARRARVLGQLLRTIWKRQKTLFLDLVVSIIVINLGVFLALIMGWFSARATLLSYVKVH